MKLFVIASLFTATAATCANECSKHGSCGEHDICTCDPNWIGGDCSEAKCPYGASWSTDTDGAEYAECSSRGACDRKTGVCKCAAGFSGASCQRTECADKCSGHGVCSAPTTAGSRVALTVQQSCSCDAGWSGYACADRVCPHGDDPLTKVNLDSVLKTSIAQADEVQTIRVKSDNMDEFSMDTFTLTYTDLFGAKYTTYPLSQDQLTAGQVERALENLPDGALSNVTVTLTSAHVGANAAASYYNEFAVTFINQPGDLNMLSVNTKGCKVAGCIPQYFGFAQANGGAIVTKTETVKGTKEHVECAGRGTCNREDGLCVCYKGFYGPACNEQSILA